MEADKKQVEADKRPRVEAEKPARTSPAKDDVAKATSSAGPPSAAASTAPSAPEIKASPSAHSRARSPPRNPPKKDTPPSRDRDRERERERERDRDREREHDRNSRARERSQSPVKSLDGREKERDRSERDRERDRKDRESERERERERDRDRDRERERERERDRDRRDQGRGLEREKDRSGDKYDSKPTAASKTEKPRESVASVSSSSSVDVAALAPQKHRFIPAEKRKDTPDPSGGGTAVALASTTTGNIFSRPSNNYYIHQKSLGRLRKRPRSTRIPSVTCLSKQRTLSVLVTLPLSPPSKGRLLTLDRSFSTLKRSAWTYPYPFYFAI